MYFPVESLSIIKGIAYPDEKLKAAAQGKVNGSKEYSTVLCIGGKFYNNILKYF